MPRIIWSQSSLADLRAIDHYLAEFDPAVSARILRSIRSKAALLAQHRFAGPATGDGYRQLTVRGTRYIIVYALGAEGAEILRVRHAMEDWRPPEHDA